VLDRINPVSRTMRAEIDVDNPKMRLLPGMLMTATVHFNKTRSAKSFTVPASCLIVESAETIIQDDGRQFAVKGKVFLYIVRGGKAHRTEVKPVFPVPIGEGEVEIREGVKASDQIVTDPKNLKGEIIPVKVKPAP
jgi:multidrug efflux pump subunit AcrA (membrane-fusion protein)